MIPLPERNSDGSYTAPVAGMQIDGDGANGQSSPPVYAPKGFEPEPLDYLANAGEPGNWYGIVTKNGVPIIQSAEADDPMPGAYVSATSYKHKGLSPYNPRAYVDSNAVVYIVLPSHWRAQSIGVVLGCYAEIYDTHTKQTITGAVLDFGPKGKLGEASIECARRFGVPHSPKNGGTEEKRFVYTYWPNRAADGFELQPM